ncbi:MAG: hydroxyisourate hydrolase [Chloroflexota bacterium]|nr:hydroxyisourate hydrolase [Chloroflexota bacterium]
MTVTGRLTTHVLDTVHGRPAVGMTIELWRLSPDSEERTLVVTTRTGPDGRTSNPLLAGDDLHPGVYELVFDVAAYFAALGVSTPLPPFLDRVPIRFGIADADAHYHVPLLASPWSYSTYRGS